MAFDEQLAMRIRAVLGARTDLIERKMFGGLAFMVRGHMCCGIVGNDLIVRVGADGYGDALARPHVRPFDFTGTPLTGIVYVAAAGVRTSAALRGWIDRGVQYVLALPPKKPRARPRMPRGVFAAEPPPTTPQSDKKRIMNIDRVDSGRDIPNDFNVIIEIPAHADPVKYEVDKETGAMFVDRFLSTPMRYPCNYGYVPRTLSGDGDPVDVLVITPFPLFPGVVVRCRALGVLSMTDEAGDDAKMIAVPVDKLTSFYKDVQSLEDLPPILLQRIAHFFEHYKDLEPNKYVKVNGWGDKAAAHKEILDGMARYKAG